MRPCSTGLLARPGPGRNPARIRRRPERTRPPRGRAGSTRPPLHRCAEHVGHADPFRRRAAATANLGSCTTGCRLDVGQLLDAGSRVARALEDGGDIVIINRFGRQEREGKGLSYLIERALSADIPVVIAVPAHRFADWIRFAGGMSVKLRCDRDALDAWWNNVFPQGGISVTQGHSNVCEVFK